MNAISSHTSPLTSWEHFWNWLWGDWGKPNFLTRLGIPRIATNLLSYLLAPIIWFILTLKYFPDPATKHAFHLIALNPFFLLAYAVFYVAAVSDEYLESRHNLKRFRFNPQEQLRFLRQNWNDVFVRVLGLSFATSFFLFLLGVLRFLRQIT